jgi:hypothetical protein
MVARYATGMVQRREKKRMINDAARKESPKLRVAAMPVTMLEPSSQILGIVDLKGSLCLANLREEVSAHRKPDGEDEVGLAICAFFEWDGHDAAAF